MKSKIVQLWDQPLAIAPSHIEDALFNEAPMAKNGSGNSLWPLENHNGACIILFEAYCTTTLGY